MAEPDLQIRGARSSRPSDKGEWGGGRSQKCFFRPFGPQSGLKHKGGGGGSPGSATALAKVQAWNNQSIIIIPFNAFRKMISAVTDGLSPSSILTRFSLFGVIAIHSATSASLPKATGITLVLSFSKALA